MITRIVANSAPFLDDFCQRYRGGSLLM